MATAVAAQDAPAANPIEKRIERLRAEDPQFLATYADPSVARAKAKPGIRLAEIVRVAMEGYADRPAVGYRARELVIDPTSGRSTFRLLPRFDTISYGEMWSRARAAAADWHNHPERPFKPGDMVCVLSFTSPEYGQIILAGIHLGAVIVPLQTSAPTNDHIDIIAETEPNVFAAEIDYLGDAVDAVLGGTWPKRLIVFNYDARDDDQRDKLELARRRLAEAGCPLAIETLDEVVERGKGLPEAPLHVPAPDENPLAWLFYSSGSTGTPKGVMFTERHVMGTWERDMDIPSITLSFMPMSHGIGNGFYLMPFGSGGTTYCSPKSDLSTLLEDLSLVRPTMASLVPRICELLQHHYIADVDRRIAEGADPAQAEQDAKMHMYEKIIGGRLVSVGCGSASLAPETYAFMEDMLGFHMPIGYSSTEIVGGTVTVDWKVQRPPVIDYKLKDVPELGYFNTDKPYPRGELLVKTERFMAGYYKRPDLTSEKVDAEGYYHTGDVMMEIEPDHIVFVDRCNNTIKLSQGEFVAISRLEALYMHHPDIPQIYIYGTAERAYLLAIVVPGDALMAQYVAGQVEPVKAAVRKALLEVAEENQLNGWEVPRDFIVEVEPFSLENGLLTEVGKHRRPELRDRYAPQLEEKYAKQAQEQMDVLRSLRVSGADRPVLETVSRAVQATLGVGESDVGPDVRFIDLGGDSLAALTFSNLLEDIFSIEVPVGVIINPAGNLGRLAELIEAERSGAQKRATFASIHGANSKVARASDLTLERFLDARLLAEAPALPQAPSDVGTVLLTGATGFLGRFQAIAWLERFARTGGKLILLARGADAAQARARVEEALESDPTLLAHFRDLADAHLEVLPGDLAAPGLGLDEATWDRLAGEVDLIVHTGAHVNHVLPYNQLFAANVNGTADLIRLALTTRIKRFDYISTMGVSGLGKGLVDEDGDIRETVPECDLDDSYANGYGVSKWASEVLLREAHDLTGLPVSVFRPGMILAHSRYAGQLNVPDMFTRLLYSLAVTGIAPGTFYAHDLSQGRPLGRYEGFTVDFLADAITAIGALGKQGFYSYNLASPHNTGSSLDDFVDWMIEAGCAIRRIDNYGEWLSRFETAMLSLPEEQRAQSMLAILGPYRQPQAVAGKSVMQVERFCNALHDAGCEIPDFTSDVIRKYVSDLRHLELL
ncbi:MAG: carboxylic acid reductase [Novosphingobium sp.]